MSALPFYLSNEISLNHQKTLNTLAAILTAVLLHGACVYWYINRPAKEVLSEAMPLPMVDIALQAPPSVQPAQQPPSIPKPAVPEPRKPLPVKKEPKKQPTKPLKHEEPPATETKAQSFVESSQPPAVTGSHEKSVSERSEISDTPAHFNADYLYNPRPHYPSYARQRHWEGLVLLKVFVTPDGHSGDIAIQKSSGHEELDESALDAVKQWKFVPAKHGETALASWVTVPIEFKLQ